MSCRVRCGPLAAAWFESRGGRYGSTVFFGLQHLLAFVAVAGELEGGVELLAGQERQGGNAGLG